MEGGFDFQAERGTLHVQGLGAQTIDLVLKEPTPKMRYVQGELNL